MLESLTAAASLAAAFLRTAWPPDRLRAFRNQKLQRVIRHAWNHVPYYRRLLDSAGVHPDHIRTTDDLQRIPITTHRDLQRIAFDERLSRGLDLSKCRRRATSGSTGEPVQIVRTPSEEHLLYGFRLRAQVLAGLRPRDRRVKLGSPPERLLLHRLGLFRASNLSLDLDPREIFSQLEALRPEVIYGIPNMFEALVNEIPEDRLRSLHPKLLFSGAEYLSPSTRDRLERVLGCPLIDFYGSHEFNLLAWQCRRCGLYHTVDDSLVFELIRDGRPAEPGQDGDVIATALHCYAMPVIRVEVGDIARRAARKPVCSLGFDVIERIQGRSVDFLPMPDGTILNPYHLIDEVNAMRGVLQFQIVQERPDRMLVLYVGRPAEPAAGDELYRRFRKLVPPQVDLRLEPVPEIRRTEGGKHRLVRAFRPTS